MLYIYISTDNISELKIEHCGLKNQQYLSVHIAAMQIPSPLLSQCEKFHNLNQYID